MNELVITNYKDSMICAVYENKAMVQVSAFQKEEAVLGNIYVGRVNNIIKNINSAFVHISNDISCYLDLSWAKAAIFIKKQSQKKISVGDELIVQVIKDEVKTKAPVVTTYFSLTGKYIVLVHHGKGIQISKKISSKTVRSRLKEQLGEYRMEGYGVVVRTNAQYVAKEEIYAELNKLLDEYRKILTEGIHQARYSVLHRALPPYLISLQSFREFTLNKIITNIPEIHEEICAYLKEQPVLDEQKEPVPVEFMEDGNELAILYKINYYMDRALRKTVFLDSGATIVIEPTEALTAIDVNTGKAISGKKASEDTYFLINMEAAKEIAAQLRLRNISGIIVIDFINMAEKEKEEQLKEALRGYLKKDPLRTELVDITKLSLVEVTRQKILKTLPEQLEDAQQQKKSQSCGN